MGHPTVEEEKNILFQGMGVPSGDELRNSSFIILPTAKKYLGIFKIFPDIPPSVVSGCIESDLLEITSTFVGSFLYIIGGRVPNDFELSDSIRWLDIRSNCKQWKIGRLPFPCADPVIGVYDDDLYILPGVWKFGYYHMDEDEYLTNQKGCIWNTGDNKYLETEIGPPKVEGEKWQWRRIRACAALDGEGLLIAMDGEKKNFFLYKPEKNEWKICEFEESLPKFIGETSFAASNGRLYILEVRGESPAFLYIYDIKEGKHAMYQKPILKFAKDLWSMDECDRVVRIVPVADDKLCFLWLGPVSYENKNEKWWSPVRILHYLKVKFSIDPNPSKSEIEAEDDKEFLTNIAELLYCLPCSESFLEELNCNSPLYCPLDAGQDQEDIISPTEKGKRVQCAVQLSETSITQQSEIIQGRDNEVEISQEEKQTPEPPNISKLTSQPQGRTVEISQEEKQTPEPQNISKQKSQPQGRTFERCDVVHQQQVILSAKRDIGGDQIQAIFDKALAPPAPASSERQLRRRKDDDVEKRTIRAAAPQVGNTDLPPDDNYTWRKYGQKDILGSIYPRAYYRCIHRNKYNCLATKQVQLLDQDPYTFEITYRGHHTCHMSSTAPSIPPPLQLPPTHTTVSSVVGRLFPVELSLGAAAGHSSSSAVQYGREVDHHYPVVADMADAMFDSGSSSSDSMEFIFPYAEDKWEATPGDKKTTN